jgi:hypothetical protein
VTDNETKLFLFWYAEDALSLVELPSKLAQTVEGFFEVGDELVVGSGLDDHVIHVDFNIVM